MSARRGIGFLHVKMFFDHGGALWVFWAWQLGCQEHTAAYTLWTSAGFYQAVWERGNTHAPILISCHILPFSTGGFKCHAVIFPGFSFLVCVCVCAPYSHVCACASYKAIYNGLNCHNCHNFFTPVSFQTCLTFFCLWNTKELIFWW